MTTTYLANSWYDADISNNMGHSWRIKIHVALTMMTPLKLQFFLFQKDIYYGGVEVQDKTF